MKSLIDYEIKLGFTGYLTPNDIREELRLLADSTSTRKAFAETVGISPQYLCDILSGKRMPGKKVLAFLGLKQSIVYIEVKR